MKIETDHNAFKSIIRHPRHAPVADTGFIFAQAVLAHAKEESSLSDFSYQFYPSVGDAYIKSGCPDFINGNADRLRVYPYSRNGEQSVLWGYLNNVDREGWRACKVRPTAAIWKDGKMLVLWALKTPVELERARPLSWKFGVDQVADSAPPLPSSGGWELVQLDPDARPPFEELEAAYQADNSDTQNGGAAA